MDYTSTYIGQTVKVIIDRPLGSKHPKHDMIYAVNYGYILDTIAPDGEEIDAYILGISEPISEFEGTCIAVLQRENDDDDKLIVVPIGTQYTDTEIYKHIHFQEQFFQSEIIRNI